MKFLERTYAAFALAFILTVLGLLIYVAGHNAAAYGMTATPEWLVENRAMTAEYYGGAE